MKYQKEAGAIWKNFVPKSGQAATVQGELLRCVEKLRWEATNNGNVNWDDGFVLILKFLESRLLDDTVFAAIVVDQTRQALARLSNEVEPYVNDDLYDDLGDRVVEYFRHCGSQPHTSNPDLKR